VRVVFGSLEEPSAVCAALIDRHTPPARHKVCKVFELKDIRLDFSLRSYAK
jgi:hypothetical protein